MKHTAMKNNATMILFTAALGAFAGAVIWVFLKAVTLGTELFRDILPENAGSPVLPFVFCAAGGLALGLLHKKFGDYPEELNVVIGRIKKNRYYDYRPMLIILVSAFIPLILGGSVGPEAGLTGIIAGLCYWIGDNVTYARKHASEFSGIGEAVTLGQLFHSPLFGIFMVEEQPQDAADGQMLPKPMKLLYYGVSTAASFLAIGILNQIFGKAMAGIGSFSEVSIAPGDYLLLILYIPVGVALYFWYVFSAKLTEKAASVIPPVVREVLCGAAIAFAGLCVPLVLYSGEEELGSLMEIYGLHTPFFLILICVLKILLTAFCIRFGWRGGHFFPVIFACACMGFALPMLLFAEPSAHVVFAAGVVTAAALGAQIKKTLAVTVLLLLCFPARMIFWLFLAALIGSRLVMLVNKLTDHQEIQKEDTRES